MDYAIRVENLTKRFRYWSDPPSALKTFFVKSLKGNFQYGERREISVLNNISFEIKQGEFVGIMGRNGAGKSTVLKLISGIYEPSLGTISVQGTIAPMIELGAGFHPDLSGYENIFLNAAVLGFGRKATMNSVDSIVDFSELGELIHMPVRNYSSGMLVRLGFSVATHLDAPILLVDEVLAVGDLKFQEKCLSKIHTLHQQGRTVILVTHILEQVRNHCNRCIVIHGAEKLFDGNPIEGTEIYKSLFATKDE